MSFPNPWPYQFFDNTISTFEAMIAQIPGVSGLNEIFVHWMARTLLLLLFLLAAAVLNWLTLRVFQARCAPILLFSTGLLIGIEETFPIFMTLSDLESLPKLTGRCVLYFFIWCVIGIAAAIVCLSITKTNWGYELQCHRWAYLLTTVITGIELAWSLAVALVPPAQFFEIGQWLGPIYVFVNQWMAVITAVAALILYLRADKRSRQRVYIDWRRIPSARF